MQKMNSGQILYSGLRVSSTQPPWSRR